MYTGNLSGILQMLNGTGQDWMVQIELPETENISAGEQWQAQLLFIAGKVVTCSVRSSADERTLLAGKEAIRWLESAQHLAWKLEMLTPRQVSLPALVSPPPVVPHRVMHPDQQSVRHTWSRRQWQIFALVDGERSAQRIATLLCQPLQLVEDVLHQLQSMSAIVMDE